MTGRARGAMPGPKADTPPSALKVHVSPSRPGSVSPLAMTTAPISSSAGARGARGQRQRAVELRPAPSVEAPQARPAAGRPPSPAEQQHVVAARQPRERSGRAAGPAPPAERAPGRRSLPSLSSTVHVSAPRAPGTNHMRAAGNRVEGPLPRRQRAGRHALEVGAVPRPDVGRGAAVGERSTREQQTVGHGIAHRRCSRAGGRNVSRRGLSPEAVAVAGAIEHLTCRRARRRRRSAPEQRAAAVLLVEPGTRAPACGVRAAPSSAGYWSHSRAAQPVRRGQRVPGPPR